MGSSESLPLVEFPGTGHPVLIWAAVGVLVLLASAVLLDLWRRAAARRRHREALWKQLLAAAKDKELTAAETHLLQTMLEHWSSDDPIRGISSRHAFDKCVESEMARVREKEGAARFEDVGVTLRDVRMRLALDYIPIGQQIHSTRELYQTQQVWMSRVADKPPRWHQGTVSAVDEARFHVAPRGQGGTPSFRAGEDIRFRMWREEDARYVFVVTYTRMDDDPVELVFAHTSSLTRLQSRAHFRVRHEQTTNVGILNAPIDEGDAFKRLTSEELKTRRAVTKIRGRMLNVSAGGFAMVLNQAVPKQVILRVPLELSSADTFDVHAHIVTTNALSAGQCLVRAAFVAIEDEDRDTIARYVSRKQQAMLHGGHHQAD
ncbi:MAG: hypothetical protein GY851_00620 [bacterium]|nr:hypothetical protein [bacterium]